MEEPDYIRAHKFSSNHRGSVLKSDICGCFYCLDTFEPNEIRDWVDAIEGVGQTALCPRCGIDAVIGSDTGFPLTEEFLQKMKVQWFW